jgi:hypothetical protein
MLYFLATAILAVILVYALRFPIILVGVLLWKLRYFVLVFLVAWAGVLYYSYWRGQHPIATEQSLSVQSDTLTKLDQLYNDPIFRHNVGLPATPVAIPQTETPAQQRAELVNLIPVTGQPSVGAIPVTGQP